MTEPNVSPPLHSPKMPDVVVDACAACKSNYQTNMLELQ